MVRRYHTGLARRLGQNLAHYRRRAGLTQEQLAEHIEDHSDTTGFSSNQDGGAGAGTREKCITHSKPSFGGKGQFVLLKLHWYQGVKAGADEEQKDAGGSWPAPHPQQALCFLA